MPLSTLVLFLGGGLKRYIVDSAMLRKDQARSSTDISIKLYCAVQSFSERVSYLN